MVKLRVSFSHTLYTVFSENLYTKKDLIMNHIKHYNASHSGTWTPPVSSQTQSVFHVDYVHSFLLPEFKKKLNDMNNMMNAKERKLQGRHRDTHTALQWLRQNRHLFKGNVHEPMMLVVGNTSL